MPEPTIGSASPLPGAYLASRPSAPRALLPDGSAPPRDGVSLSRQDPNEPTWTAALAAFHRPDLDSAAIDAVARNMASLTWDWVMRAVPGGEDDRDEALESLLALLRGLAPEVEGHSDRVGQMASELMAGLLREAGEGEDPAAHLAVAARYRNVGMLAVELACLTDEERDELADQAREALGRARSAGRLHDLGKIAMPRSILTKRGPLTAVERRVVELHPLVGEMMLRLMPGMEEYREAIRWHHERWDGAGYPDGLAGEDCPLMARVLCVVDSYDAMTEERPYRERLTPLEAMQEIVRCAGTHFDPRVAGAFARMLVERF